MAADRTVSAPVPSATTRLISAFHAATSTWPVMTIAIGVLARLALAPYTSVPHDDAVWYHASLSGYYGIDLYQRPGFSYPPVWGYLLQLVGAAVRLIGLPPEFFGLRNPDLTNAALITGDFSDIVTAPLYNVIFKMILAAVDLVTAFFVYELVLTETKDVRNARLAFAWWFLNPFVVYESAVHGAFDGLVGLSVLASVVFAVRGRPLWSGASLAVGVLTKVAPAVVAPALVIFLFMRPAQTATGRSRQLSDRVTTVISFAVGSLVATSALLGPELLRGAINNMIGSTLARTHSDLAIGGMTLFGIRHLKPFGWLLAWGYQNSPLVTRWSEIATVAVILLGALWAAVLARRDPAFVLLAGASVVLACFMLIAPTSQPQYILWFLPCITALVFATAEGHLQLAVLAVAPLVFSLAILGPTAVLAPLATYSGLLSAQVVGHDVANWYLAPGHLWGNYLGDDFFAPAILSTAAALFSLFAIWVRIGIRGFRWETD